MDLPHITVVLPYYDNPEMFRHQQEHWNKWSTPLLAACEMIVVDDCSPNYPALYQVMKERKFNFRLFRIKKNVRWNWIAAKNLGSHKAKKGWLFLTDMDHRLSSTAFTRLLGLAVSAKPEDMRYYTFDRVDAPDMTPYKIHPNTYFMHRDLFWAVGGYDEEFSGYYGTDGYYRKRLDMVSGKGIHLDGCAVIRYPREVIPDASTTEFERKTDFDREKKEAMRSKLRKNRPMKALTFPWEQLI